MCIDACCHRKRQSVILFHQNQGQTGATGMTGLTGITGYGPTGPIGTQGPTGAMGSPGNSLKLLRVSEFAGYHSEVRIFPVLQGTTVLYVQLWGAGGGGAGTDTIIEQHTSCGGGGGAGGYAEAILKNPPDSYNFLLARGGAGGIGISGEDAQTSFFSSPEVIWAEGGKGGKSPPFVFEDNFGFGGKGGTAGGSRALFSGTGGAASTYCFSGSANVSIGAAGGKQSAGSGPPFQPSILTPDSVGISLSGSPGWYYGAGGAGAQAVGRLPGGILNGGDGAPAFLRIQEFGD